MEEWKKRDGLSQLTSRLDEKIEREWWKDIVRDVFTAFGPIRNFDVFFEELYHLFASPESWRLYPGVKGILDEIKRRGKRLGIVSNWDSRLFKLCDGFGITGYFDFILASAVFGASKPGPRIFQEALDRMKIHAGEALHVGDSFEDDVRGAHALGIHTVLIDRHEMYAPHPETRIHPHYIIRDLKELFDREGESQEPKNTRAF